MDKLEQLKEDLAETEFLDPVFGANSLLVKNEWVRQVETIAGWIFDSNNIRQRIYSLVEKKLIQG